MPIVLPHPIEPLSEQAFHKLDYSVMALAFDIHNELGRFCNEEIYKNKLLEMCRDRGFETECEVEIKLIHRGYTKSLFIDLLVNGCVYELKTIKSIQEPQRIQTLDYLFATNTKHGKIINFRPASIEHEFVSTTLDHEARRSFNTKDSRWNKSSRSARELKNRMTDILNNWGAFFDTHIYTEALIHFLGGEQKVVQPVEIRNGNQLLGTQKFSCLSGTEFFLLTAAKGDTKRYETHLTRLLSHTPFEQLHWINLNRSTIQFTSLERGLFCS
jgi:GxxExxY protein